jgi:hypothetical protein
MMYMVGPVVQLADWAEYSITHTVRYVPVIGSKYSLMRCLTPKGLSYQTAELLRGPSQICELRMGVVLSYPVNAKKNSMHS